MQYDYSEKYKQQLLSIYSPRVFNNAIVLFDEGASQVFSSFCGKDTFLNFNVFCVGKLGVCDIDSYDLNKGKEKNSRKQSYKFSNIVSKTHEEECNAFVTEKKEKEKVKKGLFNNENVDQIATPSGVLTIFISSFLHEKQKEIENAILSYKNLTQCFIYSNFSECMHKDHIMTNVKEKGFSFEDFKNKLLLSYKKFYNNNNEFCYIYIEYFPMPFIPFTPSSFISTNSNDVFPLMNDDFIKMQNLFYRDKNDQKCAMTNESVLSSLSNFFDSIEKLPLSLKFLYSTIKFEIINFFSQLKLFPRIFSCGRFSNILAKSIDEYKYNYFEEHENKCILLIIDRTVDLATPIFPSDNSFFDISLRFWDCLKEEVLENPNFFYNFSFLSNEENYKTKNMTIDHNPNDFSNILHILKLIPLSEEASMISAAVGKYSRENSHSLFSLDQDCFESDLKDVKISSTFHEYDKERNKTNEKDEHLKRSQKSSVDTRDAVDLKKLHENFEVQQKEDISKSLQIIPNFEYQKIEACCIDILKDTISALNHIRFRASSLTRFIEGKENEIYLKTNEENVKWIRNELLFASSREDAYKVFIDALRVIQNKKSISETKYSNLLSLLLEELKNVKDIVQKSSLNLDFLIEDLDENILDAFSEEKAESKNTRFNFFCCEEKKNRIALLKTEIDNLSILQSLEILIPSILFTNPSIETFNARLNSCLSKISFLPFTKDSFLYVSSNVITQILSFATALASIQGPDWSDDELSLSEDFIKMFTLKINKKLKEQIKCSKTFDDVQIRNFLTSRLSSIRENRNFCDCLRVLKAPNRLSSKNVNFSYSNFESNECFLVKIIQKFREAENVSKDFLQVDSSSLSDLFNKGMNKVNSIFDFAVGRERSRIVDMKKNEKMFVFVIGGVCAEEIKAVKNAFNDSLKGIKNEAEVILGSTEITNPTTLVKRIFEDNFIYMNI